MAAQEAALNRERELNSATKDGRESVAAGNPHIVDVYDCDTRGKPSRGKKAFPEGNAYTLSWAAGEPS